MTIPWNELAIWWNEVYQGWNEVVWNEVTVILTTPPGGDASSSQGCPCIMSPVLIKAPGWREKKWSVV